MKKKYGSAILGLLLVAMSQGAEAYGLTYVDRYYDFSKLAQVVCLPMDNKAPFGADNLLLKESKAVKPVFFNNNSFTADSNLDKAELGKQIKARTGADAFLVTTFVMNEDQTDWVEGQSFPITMHEYTEVQGPEGNRIERERYYDTTYYYDAHQVNLHKLEVEFKLYETATGKHIFTFNDVRRSYDRAPEDLFKDIAKEFFVSLKDTPKQVEKTRERNLEIDSIMMNGKINDTDKNRVSVILEGFHTDLLIDGAKVKNILIPNKGMGGYALKASVYNYYDEPYWNQPFVTTQDKLVRSWSEKIKVRQDADKPKEKIEVTYKGNSGVGQVNRPANMPAAKAPSTSQPTYKEITIQHKHYKTEVLTNPGGYKFRANVSLSSQVFDKKTGEIVFTYSNTKSNDKRTDAWKALVKDFYNKLSKAVKKK